MTSMLTDRIVGASASLAIKAPVRVASTANLTLSGLQTVDGVVLVAGNRVLVKDQTDESENGIYIADTGTWERAPDFDGNRDVTTGTFVLVIAGSSNVNTYWRVTTANPITIDSSDITFEQGLVDDSGAIVFLPAGTGAVERTMQAKMRDVVSVKDFGAVGDKVTDDLAAFNLATAHCKANKLALFIPALPPGYFYRLSGAWNITDADGITVYGEGLGSLLVIANALGASCVVINSTTHAIFRDFAVHGTSGSGHAVELVNASHYNIFANIWAGHVDLDCFRVTSGQSNVFYACHADCNNGFNPATLAGTGLSNGTPERGFHIPSEAVGNTNQNTLIGCQGNAVGGTVTLEVGTSGSGAVGSFAAFGCLFQGSSVHKEVSLHCSDGLIAGGHIEPPVGVSSNWCVTLDECSNTIIRDLVLAGDVRLINGCVASGLEHVRGCGVDIAASSSQCFVRDGYYASNASGPASGLIKDRAADSFIERMKNASDDSVHAGNSVRNASSYFQSDMETWLGGGSPTVPCGFEAYGTPTITRETSLGHIRVGSYAAKVVYSSDLDEGFKIDIKPDNAATARRRIHVEAWLKNVTTEGLARIQMVEGGSGAVVSHRSCRADAYERVTATFYPSAAATSLGLRFTSGIGTVYWDSIKITVEEHTPVYEMTLADSATPSVSYGGYFVPTLVTGGTTTITGFTNQHVGRPFTVRLGAATDFTDSATLQLQGGANFTTGVAGDMITFVYGSDGVTREVCRSVN